MKGLNTHAAVRRTTLFFLLTFVLSWSIWIPLAVTGSEIGLLEIAGRFGPLVAALLLTGLSDGRAGLTQLWKRMLIWRVHPGWYLFAFLGTAVVALSAIGIHVGLGGETPRFNDPAQLYLVIPVFLYVLFLSVAGEETGWRGYALPRLQERWGPFGASVVIGLVWGVWHLPLFIMAGDFHSQIPFGLFVLQDVALSVVMTWLFNATGGSLLLVHLFHAASNTTIGVLPVLPQDTGGVLRPLWIAVALLGAVALLVAGRQRFRDRRARGASTAVLMLCAVVSLSGCVEPTSSSTITEGANAAHLDETIPRLMNRFDVPGVGVAIIREGALVWSSAYGYADLSLLRPMTVDTLFRAESISKSVTAWGVMRLVDDGLVDLQQPVVRYFHDWHPPSSTHSWDDRTVGRVLSNNAGMPLGTIGEEYPPGSPMPSLRDYLSGAAVPVEAPGSGFIYSNVGFNMLELMIEQVTGQDFGDFMWVQVLEPLRMEHATFAWSESVSQRIATGYDQRGAAVQEYLYPARASGGLFAGVEDIARFVAAAVERSTSGVDQVLSHHSITRIQTPSVEIPGLFGVVADNYGYGHFIEELPDGRTAVWHGGQGHGWMTHFHLVPESGDGIVILTNSQRSWPFISGVLRDWARWSGIGSVKMGRITVATAILQALIAIALATSLTALVRLALAIRAGRRSFRPFSRVSVVARFVQTGAGLATIGVLTWSAFQPYLFVSSIFLDTASWAAGSLLVVAVSMLLFALCPRVGGQDDSNKS